MILDDVRDKALETLQVVKSKLDESETFNRLKERYDSLSPIMQKTIQSIAALVVALILFQFPKSFYDTGTENLALFEENRDLTLNLYRIKRLSITTPQTVPPLQASELEGRARTAVTAARVQPEQIKGISLFDNAGPHSSSFIPKEVTQAGVEVRLANLNLTQIVDIGHQLTNQGSAKIVGLDVRPGTAVGNYFDATFKVVSFNFPSAPPPKAPARKK